MTDRTLLDSKIVPFLKRTLPPQRLNHVLGVMRLAEKLARSHGLNPARTKLAASLHDAARCWKGPKLIAYVRSHHLKVPGKKFLCEIQPMLLHSFVGADLAFRKFGVKDREVLSAIAKHSLASLQMSPFEKLIFLADLLAPDRKFPEVFRLRKLALQDLNAAFVEGLKVKLNFLLRGNEVIHPSAVKIWNHFVSRFGIKP